MHLEPVIHNQGRRIGGIAKPEKHLHGPRDLRPRTRAKRHRYLQLPAPPTAGQPSGRHLVCGDGGAEKRLHLA
ncbi:hypothetical protein N7489_008875 [Penicillium chrysogenum]|uniref:Uncharacterized protein n=1 Tax=Penicillium chrysogenum TaxID=5076 RepID=A0ABQ8WZQ9_PENCH|nr:uncharacterized protein N7489_008875 [Penicillium chrysogenum]XP_061069620.1 uncharacterized protein N7525_003080 [Penicillium rubens]KAJ5228167.1 hypothetical protein N7489_008875 [Penicillium chrysogenum]KAJ5257565.1 hypothetical protein N7524_009121 [Penicillium chrysogenum]KAJ5284196.1 hypothetical protein N7505_002176 [Penicillium chrysogenum]KAJ5837892.1 hypothetical protein N7525_003080 [Penicillium rubens]KAJ5865939.1 hypothetical protein N7534_000492 [Penicillium rubens]